MLIYDDAFDDECCGLFGSGAHVVYAGTLGTGVHEPRLLTDLGFFGGAKRSAKVRA